MNTRARGHIKMPLRRFLPHRRGDATVVARTSMGIRVIRSDGVVKDLGRMGPRPTLKQRLTLWRLRRRTRRN